VNIVLHQPEIPLNTGNIGRTCAATATTLHLIRPLGFFTDDKALKKAGMDYWSRLDVRYYDDYDDFLIKNGRPKVYLCETRVARCYAEVRYEPGSFFMFGSESAGLPQALLDAHPHDMYPHTHAGRPAQSKPKQRSGDCAVRGSAAAGVCGVGIAKKHPAGKACEVRHG
jgi:tRNA (cytidine(34)-2'-O)-methyltransferase